MGLCLSRSAVLHIAGAVSFFAWLLLAWRSRTQPAVPVLEVFAALAVAWVALVLAWTAARKLAPAELVRPLLVWCVLFRTAGFLGAPLLEDDWARYLWDGRQFALTGTPYGTPPAAHFSDAELGAPFGQVLDEINHPHLPTLYGPVCQIAFLASYSIAPGEVWPLKLILLSADLLTLALLIRLVPLRHALLYAWCPLLIQEVAFTAHPDILWVMLVVAAVHALQKGRGASAAIFAGLAMAAKVFAAPFVPLLFARPGDRKWVAGSFLIAAVAYAPFMLASGVDVLYAMRPMTAGWEFNATGFAMVGSLFGSSIAHGVAVIAFGAIWLRLFQQATRRREGEIPRGDLMYGAFFLLSPVANPWYLLALLPFITVQPSAWGMTALAAVPLSYAHGLYWRTNPPLAPYELPLWVPVAELSAVLLALGVGAWWRKRSLMGASAPERYGD